MNGGRPVAETEVLPTEEVVEKLSEEKSEEETAEELKKRSRKPPNEGKCVECGELKPLNRLKLCYKCWIKLENEKSGWSEGNPHPGTCGCDLDCAQDKNSFGN
jgi:hypothetical protein